MRDKPEAVIFDLDGVLVDTAVFHLAAWRRIANELGFTFDDGIAESLKGVGREAALRTILRAGRIEMVPEVIVTTAKRKNEYYNDYLRSVDETALLPGAMESLTWLHDHAVPFALASASRNARTILRLTGIE